MSYLLLNTHIVPAPYMGEVIGVYASLAEACKADDRLQKSIKAGNSGTAYLPTRIRLGIAQCGEWVGSETTRPVPSKEWEAWEDAQR